MVLADISFTTEGMTVITSLLGVLAGAVFYLHKAFVNAVISERDTWKNMALEASTILDAVAAKEAAAPGKRPRRRLLQPVPEHSSPVTPKQRDTALQTGARASLVLARKELGLPPRTEKECFQDLVKIVEEKWFKEPPEVKDEIIVLTNSVLEIPDGTEVSLIVPENSVVVPKPKPGEPTDKPAGREGV